MLDADIRSCFDTMKHDWVVKFIEHGVADDRVVRLIRKWLSAGLLEDGMRMRSEKGAVPEGSISRLPANVYLHRYADDFVVGFGHKRDADRSRPLLRRAR